jgi:hypothetical protein
MKYFLATYEIIDGEHEHKGALIIEAETPEKAWKIADSEEFDPTTDNGSAYFSFCGDGLIGCRNNGCTEITAGQMRFLERVGLACRR